MPPISDIAIAIADPLDPDALASLAQYYAELDRRFPGGFVVARSHDPETDAIRPPRGAFLLARRGGEVVGCVALKGAGGPVGEVKRLWVAPGARGQGLARTIMDEVERIARERSLRVLRLDTNSALPEAIAMYRRWDWREVPRFNDDPYAEVFFEKALP